MAGPRAHELPGGPGSHTAPAPRLVQRQLQDAVQPEERHGLGEVYIYVSMGGERRKS